MGKLRTILILGRVSNLPTVWTNVLAGWFLAGGRWSVELVWIELGVSLLYVAGMTLNDAFDAEWDREYAPERPIASGAMRRSSVWALGIFQMALGAALLIGFTDAGWQWVAGLIAAILLYDWVHKKTAWAVVLMGGCRGLVYLLAGSAASKNAIDWFSVLAIPPAVMILYIAGITLSARSERSKGGRPRLFLCWMAAVFALGGALLFLSPAVTHMTTTKVLVAVPILIWLLHCSQVGASRGIGPMIGKLIAGITLFDAFFIFVFAGPVSALDFWSARLPVVLVCVALLPVTLFLQRRIPAT